MICLHNISKTYAMGEVAVQALRGVSLEIKSGEFVAIMGPSGSGKSTLLHILGLLDVSDTGSFQLLGHEIGSLSDNALAVLRNSSIGFIFQHFNLLARASAEENVVLPMFYSADTVRQNLKKARQLLREVGLGDRLTHRPNELSGGQQQRVAIARALIHDPRIIMADEPTGNLDSASSAEIMEILTGLNRRGITVIMVTHEQDVADHAQRIIRMRDGVIVSDSPSKTVQDTKNLSATVAAATQPVPLTRSRHPLAEAGHNFRQAWRALMANKVRSSLSMLGILIGVAAVIAMLAIGAGASEAIKAELSRLGTNLLVMRPGPRYSGGVALEAGAIARFTPQDVVILREKVSSIKQLSGVVSGRAQITYGNKNWNSRITGAEPAYASMRANVPPQGRFFNEQEMAQRARVAVLGMVPKRELFGDANPVGQTVKINKINFLVIGVLPEKGDSSSSWQDDLTIIPLSTAMYRLLGRQYLDNLEMEIDSLANMESAQQEIISLVNQTHRIPPAQTNAFRISNMVEIQDMLSETSRTMSILLAVIAAVSLLVGGIGIMNIMLVSVTERTREIGIRKAVGAQRRDILAQFLTEALAVGIIGGGMGILLGWLISLGVAMLAGWPIKITLFSIILAVGFAALIGIVFGLWPAQKAARLHPIDALRYE